MHGNTKMIEALAVDRCSVESHLLNITVGKIENRDSCFSDGIKWFDFFYFYNRLTSIRLYYFS